MKLPQGMKAVVRDDPPLLKHIEVVEADGKRSYTTIGMKDDADAAVAKLVANILHLPVGVDPNRFVKDADEDAEVDRKRDARRERRRLRKLRRQQEIGS